MIKQYFSIMKIYNQKDPFRHNIKSFAKISLEPELVQFLSMEHCAISKDLLTTPLTTKISATFFRSKQVIGLLMICSETRIGRIFQSPWHRLEITLLSTVFYSFQWNYFFLCLLILCGISWCLFSVILFFLLLIASA